MILKVGNFLLFLGFRIGSWLGLRLWLWFWLGLWLWLWLWFWLGLWFRLWFRLRLGLGLGLGFRLRGDGLTEAYAVHGNIVVMGDAKQFQQDIAGTALRRELELLQARMVGPQLPQKLQISSRLLGGKQPLMME